MGRKLNNEIQFHYLTKAFNLRERKRLKTFLRQLIQREGRRVKKVNYIFCTDEYLLTINRQFLKHNTYTDIITFDLSVGEKQPILSDIFISVERVKDNAATFSSTFTWELHRVIFHGSLHLCGYKDKNSIQQKLMRSKEDEYLNKYFVPREIVPHKH